MEVSHVPCMYNDWQLNFYEIDPTNFSGSRRLTEAVGHTGRTYDSIGELFTEQVCKMLYSKFVIWILHSNFVSKIVNLTSILVSMLFFKLYNDVLVINSILAWNNFDFTTEWYTPLRFNKSLFIAELHTVL